MPSLKPEIFTQFSQWQNRNFLNVFHLILYVVYQAAGGTGSSQETRHDHFDWFLFGFELTEFNFSNLQNKICLSRPSSAPDDDASFRIKFD